MSFSMQHSLNQPPLQENHWGSLVVSSQQPPYNSYGYLQPGTWALPQQQFAEQQSYGDQYKEYKIAYGPYCHQAPWLFNQHQNEYNELQGDYWIEHFRDHSRLDCAKGGGISNGLGSNLSTNLFVEGSNSVNKENRRTCQSEQHDPHQAVISMKTPPFLFS